MGTPLLRRGHIASVSCVYYLDGALRTDVTVNEREWLAEQFEDNRAHLRAVAYRMLGSVSEADDAVQEFWLRLSRSDPRGVENLRRGSRLAWHACASTCCARAGHGARSLWSQHSRADRQPRGGGRPRARGASRRLGRPRAARGARDADTARAARVRAARHVRRSRSTRSLCWWAPPAATRQLASRARRRVQGAPGAGRRSRQRSESSSMPSSLPRAALTSKRWLRCSTPTWCFESTAARAGEWKWRCVAPSPLPSGASPSSRLALLRAARARQRRRRVRRERRHGRLLGVAAFTVRTRQDRRDRSAHGSRTPAQARPDRLRSLTVTGWARRHWARPTRR